MKGAALLIVSAIATGFGTQYNGDWPPEHWRGVGTTSVTFVRTHRGIDRLCGKAPRGVTFAACTTDKGLIVLPDPCGYPGEFARIVCHENAHRFRNWPEDHPL